VLVLDREAGELLLGFERDLEPGLAAGSGDLTHLAGWAAKLAGATCRMAAFATAIQVTRYPIEHARAVFDLMGADPRVDDDRRGPRSMPSVVRSLGDFAVVGGHGEGVGDDEDADTPGQGDPDVGADGLL